MFLAHREVINPQKKNRHLGRAYSLLKGDKEEEAQLVCAEVAGHLDKDNLRGQLLNELIKRGSIEAEMYSLQDSLCECLQEYLDYQDPAVFDSLTSRIESYRERRPMDPRIFIIEANIAAFREPESAPAILRHALTLDERCAETWGTIGLLFMNQASQNESKEPSVQLLKDAHEAYVKAVDYSPYNLHNRLMLGILEKDVGYPDQAVMILAAVVALSPRDTDARRHLALAWLKLAAFEYLAPEARTLAAAHSREEWEKLPEFIPDDLAGFIRATLIEGEDLTDIPFHVGEALKLLPELAPKNRVKLVNDLINASFLDEAALLLDAIEKHEPDSLHLQAGRAAIMAKSSPQEAVRLYLDIINKDSGEAAESDVIAWTLNAAEIAAQSEAEAILRGGLSRFPHSKKILSRLFSLFALDNREDEALDLYREAVEKYPDDIQLLQDAVWSSWESHKQEVGESLLEAYCQRHPDNALIWNQLGMHYMGGKLDLAIDAYRKAVELSPNYPAFLGSLADALCQAGRWTEAFEALEKGGDEPLVVNHYAHLLDERSTESDEFTRSSSDWERAGEYYAKAAELAHDSPEFYQDHAWWLYRERRLEEAISVYKQALTYAPEDGALLYGEFSCWRDLGDDETALQVLERAMASYPDEPMMIVDKADILENLGRKEEAEKLYEELASLDEKPVWLWARLAELKERRAAADEERRRGPRLSINSPPVYDVDSFYAVPMGGDEKKRETQSLEEKLSLGQFDEVKALLEESLAHGPSPSEYRKRHLLGVLELLGSQRDPEAAIRCFTQALAMSPRSWRILADLGLAYAFQEDWNKSFSAFFSASEINPQDVLLAANAGIAAYRSGRFNDAADLLGRAIQEGGADAELNNALGLTYLAQKKTSLAQEALQNALIADPGSDEYAANLMMVKEGRRIPDKSLQ